MIAAVGQVRTSITGIIHNGARVFRLLGEARVLIAVRRSVARGL